MRSLASRLGTGAAAGAAGTLALSATTWLDMALRGRPASDTPEHTVEKVAALLALPLPADAEKRSARLSAIAALLGMGAGVTAGMVLALLGEATGRRGTAVTSGTAWVLAMVVGDGPMTALGVTDPRTWSRAEWATDVVPHLAYAAAAAATLRRLEQD